MFPLARNTVWLLASCFPLMWVSPSVNSAVISVGRTPQEVFRELLAERWLLREITFAELGFKGPLVLGSPDSRREIYLPVPAHVPLSDGELKLNAHYMRADGGRTSLMILLDTFPVSSRPFPLEAGDASIVLGVDGAPRPSGFVRLGLNWDTALGADWLCTDGRTPGNLLRIEPDSRFTYRYDASAIRDLTTAWGALPAVPVILIANKSLSSEAYDSAWRIGLALERVGKRSRILALPAVGDVVDLAGVTIPPGLLAIPAFAALAQGDKHPLKDAAEVGALLSLGQSGPLHPDLIITDKTLAANMKTALDALLEQIKGQAPEAVAGFSDWRAHALDPAGQSLATKEIRLVYGFGRPTIVLAGDAGAQAAGLFSSYWNQVAVAPALVVKTAGPPTHDAAAVSLAYLGGKPGSFDVLAHADWNASFDIGAVAADGRVPAKLVLDVAAAPSAGRTPLVVSIFMNDTLLGAQQMKANGQGERITAPIPGYALAARNNLRVSFVRQMASDRCRETPEPYPVSVLPSSHMLLDKASPSDDFKGMVSRYAGGAHVMVPMAYLADALNTLPRVIRLAASTGVSPLKARFTAVSPEAAAVTGGAFLALEIPFKDAQFKEAHSKVKLDAGRVMMTTRGGQALLDVKGLNQVGILEVVKVGDDTGVIYRSVGQQPPAMDKPFLLAQGDVALIGTSGLLREINTTDPGGSALIAPEDSPWLTTRGYWWMLPIIAVVFMIALLVFASRMRRRRASDRSQAP